MKCLNFYFAFSLCFGSPYLLAQTPHQVEVDLLKSFRKIDYWYQKTHDTTSAAIAAEDSLVKVNDVFADQLKYFSEKFAFTIAYPFKSVRKESLDISTSTDGLFRIYSWDTWTGGTEHFFENVFQYRAGQKIKTKIDTLKFGPDEVNDNYHKIFTFTFNGRSYYLAIYLHIGSTKDIAEGIHIFTAENEILRDAKLVKTHSGLHNDLSYYYDFGSVVSIDYDKRPTIKSDNVTNTIYLPLIDEKNQMTNKFIVYKFTGQYFERVKN